MSVSRDFIDSYSPEVPIPQSRNLRNPIHGPRRPDLHWCPASEVRQTPRQSLRRTSEAKGAPARFINPVPLIDLQFLHELSASDAGTANRRHWRDCGSTTLVFG